MFLKFRYYYFEVICNDVKFSDVLNFVFLGFSILIFKSSFELLRIMNFVIECGVVRKNSF